MYSCINYFLSQFFFFVCNTVKNIFSCKYILNDLTFEKKYFFGLQYFFDPFIIRYLFFEINI